MKPRKAEKAPTPKQRVSQNDKLCSVSQAQSEGKVRVEISRKLQQDAGII